MNIFSFTAHFGSEEDCRLHFKEQRDKEGVVCKRCGGTSHYWLQGKWSYECKGCRFRTSLRSGTIMESSKLPFLVWYKTMFLMSCTKKGFSTNELQKQLGLKRYEPVWAMVHKLRRAMGNRDARYTLEGMIELDEGYFSVASKEIERGKGTRGRGAEGKQNVAVMAESTPLEDIETGKKEKHVRYFKARVLDSHQSEGINGVVRDCMEDDAIVFSDKSTSYVDISDLVELHVTEKSDAKTTKETLKWVHIAISNAKRTLLGNYHKIKRKYLQLYLNEFIYKLNRLLLFPFLYETDAQRAKHKQDTRSDEHVRLDSAQKSQHHSAERRGDDLRKADGAVEQAEIAAQMLPVESVGQKCERKREHRGPGGSDQQVRHAEQVLVVDERNGDEADGSDQKAHHIGQFQGAELRKYNRPQD